VNLPNQFLESIYRKQLTKYMVELKRCKKCLLPETHESIIFDVQGICNICRQNEFKNEKIDWAKRKEELTELIESHRGKYDYDCIVPLRIAHGHCII
jgi:hypothetical protein